MERIPFDLASLIHASTTDFGTVVESCPRLQVPVCDYFSTILPGLPISRSGASQALLPLCGSPDIHRPGY
jgi:hypothetical protein